MQRRRMMAKTPASYFGDANEPIRFFIFCCSKWLQLAFSRHRLLCASGDSRLSVFCPLSGCCLPADLLPFVACGGSHPPITNEAKDVKRDAELGGSRRS